MNEVFGIDDRPAAKGLADKVAADLGMKIVRETFPAGSALPTEPELARDYNVGRNAVREAVRTLVGKGLITTERRAGTIVQPKPNWSVLDPDVMDWMLSGEKTRSLLIRELTELRFIIEPEAAALAARKAKTTDILRIFEAYEEMEEFANDPVRAIDADIKFHHTLFQATHNLLVANYTKAIFVLLRANFKISIQADRAFVRNLGDHRLIAEAVHERNPEGAREATLQLLNHNARDLEAMAQEKAVEGGLV